MVLTLLSEGAKCLNKALIRTLGEFFLPRRMEGAEARSILALSGKYTDSELHENYERLYNANDAKRGGSGYIQRKIRGAFQILSKKSDS